MLTGAIKAQINKMRDDLWSGGVSNPMTGVELFPVSTYGPDLRL